ncbi:glycoside hydrolase family 16 protein [Siphonobacter sp. SORGH_AS_0500]|uniref:glycoside hydrolase family 16 protein n=1 Tax=Siphonobacter sp. SORGH_AS_0500 TaxID=1864824 RepID=UPI00285716D7|nr:glycoside hydrolase family 16 protein [Siphonobacter sp. SORGH_AS_0500]MDR6193188.1 beta-glucanase (GH16 family) [Siphonobacter sp. SORGH_AS_0500]
MIRPFLLLGSVITCLSFHPPQKYKLVWADEFNTNGEPNPKNWTFEKGFVRNGELQWYQSENARCENGFLIIEARKESRPNPLYEEGSMDWRKSRKTIDYTSSSLLTRDLHAWQYGRFEMRAKLDVQPGMWPAFWTLGIKGQWPSNGEIDIMEYYQNTILANTAWGTDQAYKAKWNSVKTPLSTFNDPEWADKFHVWRMDWDEKEIRLYVDDQLLNTTELSKTLNADGSNPFHQPHYVLVNLALGGDNGGDPSASKFPARYEIDYMRVYQRGK